MKSHWILNTSNQGKMLEFQRLFAKHGISLTPRQIDLEEIDSDPVTVVVHKASQLEEEMLAEDTSLDVQGISVGIHVRWLLQHLSECVEKKALWRVLLAYKKKGLIHVYEGIVPGRIVQPRGVEGFGFDPLFLPDHACATLAESKPDAVNARAKAVEAFIQNKVLTIVSPITHWKGLWQLKDIQLTEDTASLLRKIQEELSKKADTKTREIFRRFFKHDVHCYGVKGPLVRNIAKEHFKVVKTLGKVVIFSLCEKLFRSKLCEEAFIAAHWLDWISHALVPDDMKTFEQWIDQYIDDWAKCDTLCTRAIGSFLIQYPALLSIVKQWASSLNPFVRRAAAVSLILPARKGMFLDEVFEISDRLLLDKEDLVQKGYGWMLKEASRKHPDRVFSYLMQKKSLMPRTAFRYALEKMAPELRKIAMERPKHDKR